jgi:predicted deacetylase
MTAKYLIRLDDACPTMDQHKWQQIEQLLDQYQIKPLVAVIPDNQDPKLKLNPENPNFWQQVSTWQQKGWEIALHGFQHKYVTKDNGLVPISDKSEFAGLSLPEQIQKIKQGWEIFQKNQIKANVWIAPSHSFDQNTCQALKQETNIQIISDGISLFPYQAHGFFWVPQQLWKFKKMPFGLYTICLHPNTMQAQEFKILAQNIAQNRHLFINFSQVKLAARNKSFFEVIFAYLFFKLLYLKKAKAKLNK